jgi:hypothetical protein
MSFAVGISIYGTAVTVMTAILLYRYLRYLPDPIAFCAARFVVGLFGVVAAWATIDVPLAARISFTVSGLCFMLLVSMPAERQRKGSPE